MEIFQAIRILILFALSFSVALFLTPFVVRTLTKLGIKKTNIRDASSAPVFFKFHQKKSNTPTMGGVIIWGTVILLAGGLFVLNFLVDGMTNYLNFVSRSETYLPLAALLFAALLGLADDILGIMGKGPHGGGLTVKHKLIIYTFIAAVGAWWFYFRLGWDVLWIPFIGNISMGWWYIPFFMFIIIATSFSANETDGLDGLLAGVISFAFAAIAIVAFMQYRFDLSALSSVILGALFAFLWFNVYPAKFFMGDTGSMSLGIVLGVMAMLTNTSILLPFFGFILLVESLSVIIQKISKKIRKKKIFLSTPIHHHFEGIGWPESQITMRFWLISGFMTTLGLALFFLARFA